MASFCELSKDYRATTMIVYFLSLSPQEFLVLVWSTSEGWKAESTLELPRGLPVGPWIGNSAR